MKNYAVVALASLLLVTSVFPVEARQDNAQIAEATVFFNDVLQKTKNPVIAELASKSLKKLQDTHSLDNAHEVEVPLMPQISKSPVVPAVVNGNTNGLFIVDTGATYTVITPRLARKLGVDMKGNNRIQIATANGLVSAPIVRLQNVVIGGVEVKEVDAIVKDLGNDILVAGLLGMNFFKDMDLTIRQDKLVINRR